MAETKWTDHNGKITLLLLVFLSSRIDFSLEIPTRCKPGEFYDPFTHDFFSCPLNITKCIDNNADAMKYCNLCCQATTVDQPRRNERVKRREQKFFGIFTKDRLIVLVASVIVVTGVVIFTAVTLGARTSWNNVLNKRMCAGYYLVESKASPKQHQANNHGLATRV